MPRPPAEDLSALGSWLESALDRAAENDPDPGRPASYRLTRTQYVNSIRDLLALEIDGPSLLPPDDLAFGFDTIADTLSFSPLLLERYLSAARKISRLVVGDPALNPAATTYTTSPLAVQSGRMSEELPFGSGGGLAIRHRFPLDGEYVLTISLQRRRTSQTRELDVRLDGKRLRLIRLEWYDRSSAYGQPAAPDPTVRFSAGAGTRTVGISFLQRTPAPEGLGPARLPVGSLRGGYSDWGVRSLRIDGPIRVQGSGDTPSRSRIFICRPLSAGEADELDCARRILANLVRRAYRRPVTNDDIEPLLEFYWEGRSRGGFDTGIQSALERILVDPEFLFRVERDPAIAAPSTAFDLSGLDLASRLSFFLWSSVPDEELLEAAADGKLSDPEEPGGPGQADARRQPVQGPGDELRNPVAPSPKHPGRDPGREPVSGLGRQSSGGAPAGDGAVPGEPTATRSERDRPAGRRLHLCQRTSGSTLRDSPSVWEPVSKGEPGR